MSTLIWILSRITIIRRWPAGWRYSATGRNRRSSKRLGVGAGTHITSASNAFIRTALRAIVPMRRREKWIIAHRGAHSKQVPENTLSAFEEAIKLGVDMVEFDVRRLADATLVIHHDAEIRTEPL